MLTHVVNLVTPDSPLILANCLWKEGSQSFFRILFRTPEDDRCEISVEFFHDKAGPEHTIWEPKAVGKMNSLDSIAFSEMMTAFAADGDMDHGEEKFQDMIKDLIEKDWSQWDLRCSKEPNYTDLIDGVYNNPRFRKIV